ncbi:lysosomal-associated transmembrane protein 4B [Neodiprion pinetum]|uniref:Lysosomal-associated transmembrane protein 4B n=1 Tax=Neodiprion lecontei TaxID=441921 RepID=A0A6J0B286_NEOLC|nr:lysosomal-associated transmembrane protein 4B [Neodiprion lecontei]XP_046411258.1 lysosomal-associated transmembrane protein 4B-like [Neodiprion fabricii]XP_046466141.1 lysosomal-associated transmembrane protein 4B-like [Neodiprion pinetum]XP_046603899.1 lysosomal-associated transmembrane protein 4B-like [Neodiprion virginianus]
MQLTTCCRCCSLRTGTIISGICGIILAVIAIIIMLTTEVEWKTIVIDFLPQSVVKIILAINLCMTILISTLLIIGVCKRNTFLMLPWVVLGIMLAVSLLISVIYTSVMLFMNDDVLNGSLWIVFGLISVVVYVYMWLVVYSFFQQLRFEKANVRIGPYGRPYNYRKA